MNLVLLIFRFELKLVLEVRIGLLLAGAGLATAVGRELPTVGRITNSVDGNEMSVPMGYGNRLK